MSTDKNVIETCSFRDEDDDCTYHYTVNYPLNITDKEHHVLVKKREVRSVPILDLWGALRKIVSWGGGGMRMDETHLSVFHSVSNRARGERSRNSISSAARISSRFFLLFF